MNDVPRRTKHAETSASPQTSGAKLLGMRQVLPNRWHALRQRHHPHSASGGVVRRQLGSITRSIILSSPCCIFSLRPRAKRIVVPHVQGRWGRRH